METTYNSFYDLLLIVDPKNFVCSGVFDGGLILIETPSETPLTFLVWIVVTEECIDLDGSLFQDIGSLLRDLAYRTV